MFPVFLGPPVCWPLDFRLKHSHSAELSWHLKWSTAESEAGRSWRRVVQDTEQTWIILCITLPFCKPHISVKSYYVLISLLGSWGNREGSVAKGARSPREAHAAQQIPSTLQWGNTWPTGDRHMDLETSTSQYGAVGQEVWYCGISVLQFECKRECDFFSFPFGVTGKKWLVA